jgi:hypothetical protein
MQPLLLFTTGLLKRWWALLSCAAFTGLGVYAAASNKGNVWIVSGSAILAVVFFVVAAYETWRDEHRSLEVERSRNQQPDIQGEAFNFEFQGPCMDGVSDTHRDVTFGVTFDLFLCNHRPVDTTLKAVVVEGSRLKPPVKFEFTFVQPTLHMVPFPLGEELPHGKGKKIEVAVLATVDGMHFAELPPIHLDNLQIHVVDAFGLAHLIHVKPGERLG